MELMERDSPQRLAYRYLEEAEEQQRSLEISLRSSQQTSVHQYSTPTPPPPPPMADVSYRDVHHAAAITSPVATSPSFIMTPIPRGPLSAFGTARSLLTSQMDKMSTAEFNTSVELRSPFKRHMEVHLVRENKSLSPVESRPKTPTDLRSRTPTNGDLGSRTPTDLRMRSPVDELKSRKQSDQRSIPQEARSRSMYEDNAVREAWRHRMPGQDEAQRHVLQHAAVAR